MGYLLGIEWLKLKSYRTFWVMVLLFSVPLALFYISVSLNLINIGGNGISILGKATSFRQIWNDLCFFASYFVIALAILMAILTTNEYQYRTNRQHVIDGWSRMQFYHSKWMVVLLISLGTTLFTAALGLITGIIGGADLSTVSEHAERLFYLFVLCVNYLGFSLMLSILLKRSGLAIGVLMLYSMIVEVILHTVIVLKYGYPAANMFLPLQSSDELLPFGASRMLEQFAGKIVYFPPEWAYLLASAGWILIYYFVGRKRLEKSDW